MAESKEQENLSRFRLEKKLAGTIRVLAAVEKNINIAMGGNMENGRWKMEDGRRDSLMKPDLSCVSRSLSGEAG